ncbi:hypothetical protein C8Q69DRAFT_451607 [Paecilomyces variotii]|uniref:Uncharacterized protein n=1 Tax=Byssochlamys spectabilis TaxID=264951 RepID=A0A443I6E9_BYSSP|nr:hypothetical protein C8Q69DRAFT_451607 [Paecilomyces variotii]RWQ99556.1 hypothetical protein C8Q69DRAFT_451607 [Paecilomyces variotii]
MMFYLSNQYSPFIFSIICSMSITWGGAIGVVKSSIVVVPFIESEGARHSLDQRYIYMMVIIIHSQWSQGGARR